MIRYKDALEIAKRYPFELKCSMVHSEGYVFEYKKEIYVPYLEILADGSKIHFINIENMNVKERIRRSRLIEIFI